MIIVHGSVVVQVVKLTEVLDMSLAHVARSRAEPGCIMHSVHVDCENPNRLVFVEQWSDMMALQAHFKVPESRAFGKALTELATEPPTIELFDSMRIPIK